MVIGKVLLQLMDARTFVRNQVGIKTGYTKDVRTTCSPFEMSCYCGASDLPSTMTHRGAFNDPIVYVPMHSTIEVNLRGAPSDMMFRDEPMPRPAGPRRPGQYQNHGRRNRGASGRERG